jgi:HAT1-interacting factor 1
MASNANTPVMTPDQSMSAEDALNSVRISLADLCAKGTSHFAHKNYTEAADYFARASELQAELNGEMDPENAEILFLYGRSLFKVGQSKSDVLGGKAEGKKKKPKEAAKSKPKEDTATAAPSSELDKIAEDGVALVAKKNGIESNQEDDAGPKKPLFQFTGDENFEDSDEEGEVRLNPSTQLRCSLITLEQDDEGGGDEEEEEDDLAVAFEVLDLARVLYTRKLEQPEEGEEKGKSVGDSSRTKHIKERLSDTHDLLAEISLENERSAKRTPGLYTCVNNC